MVEAFSALGAEVFIGHCAEDTLRAILKPVMPLTEKPVVEALRALEASLTTIEDYQATTGVTVEVNSQKLDQIIASQNKLLENQEKLLDFIGTHEHHERWREQTEKRISALERPRA